MILVLGKCTNFVGFTFTLILPNFNFACIKLASGEQIYRNLIASQQRQGVIIIFHDIELARFLLSHGSTLPFFVRYILWRSCLFLPTNKHPSCNKANKIKMSRTSSFSTLSFHLEKVREDSIDPHSPPPYAMFVGGSKIHLLSPTPSSQLSLTTFTLSLSQAD